MWMRLSCHLVLHQTHLQYFNNYAVIKEGITAQFGELDAVYLDALCEEIYG